MAYKDILVVIDDTPQSVTRLKLAVKLAHQYDACLTGIYVIPPLDYMLAHEGKTTKVENAEELFGRSTAESEVSAKWLAVDRADDSAGIATSINHHAHMKDLVIIGQGQSGTGGASLPQDVTERVVLGAGRPVLIIPYAGTFTSVGERVIVAWKDGRAEARALGDAMPFLKNAKQVRVLTISPTDKSPHIDLQNDDIVTHLEHHNINTVQENLITGKIPVANLLMQHAWENGCDLVVMGTYATITRNTMTVGPVAKELFKSMTVPVLMSY